MVKPHKKLPNGYEDLPGYACLPRMSPLLCVGNQYGASLSDFDIVISTITPKDRSGRLNSKLSSFALLFEDEHGRESASEATLAQERIVEGAALVATAIKARRHTLVHCEWGQNRSGSICCAFAVLYLQWSAKDAIKYLRAQNHAQRQYVGQSPMSNPCFNRLMLKLEKQRAKIVLSQEQRKKRCARSGFSTARCLRPCKRSSLGKVHPRFTKRLPRQAA
mmetsp:Transcript_98816/g.178398  ORF Transcript_98816/g.178398 Transcript_98816/m.178398 type:complete len:220 (+) Transcript_98816:115-774(+)